MQKIIGIIGTDKLSWMRYQSIKSWIKWCPNCDIYIYRLKIKNLNKTWGGEVNQDYFNYDGINYWKDLEKLDINIINVKKDYNIPNISVIQQSDIFRWELLSNENAIYFDTDIILFRPITDFINNFYNNHNIGICFHTYFYIGFLFNNSGNRFYQDLFKQSLLQAESKEYQNAGAFAMDKVLEVNHKITIAEQSFTKGKPREVQYIKEDDKIKCFQIKYPNFRLYNIPLETVYPFFYKIVQQNYLTDIKINSLGLDTFGYHWFGGLPEIQNLNNLLNHNNYKRVNCLFTNIVRYNEECINVQGN